MESSEAQETIAKEYVQALVDAGKAEELMDAYSEHSQSCFYIWGIVSDVATDTSGNIHPYVRNFARNLLDDWSK